MKKKVSTIAILLAVTLLSAVACKPSQSTSSSESFSESSFQTSSVTEEPEVELYMLEKLELKKFNTAEISYSLIGTQESIVWTSSDENVATVENGIVTGVEEGEATITATVAGVSATCKVTITENTTYPTLILSQYDAKPRVGGSVLVTAAIRFNGEVVDFDDFMWTSENEAVATVENGNITGVSAGETIIKAETTYNGVVLYEEIVVTVVQFNS